MFVYVSDSEWRSDRTVGNWTGHISDHDLERHYLGMVTDEGELAEVEGHLRYCVACVERAEESQAYVDAMRVAGSFVDDAVGLQ
jgi:hypothetical protein